jgi:hypothetical protein
MKIIDNIELRKQEALKRLNPTRVWQDKAAAAQRKEAEKKALTLSVPYEWRIAGEVEPLTPAIWEFESDELKRRYLKEAIADRNSLPELILEPFEPVAYENIEITLDKETMKSLNGEARKLGMPLKTYAQAILYTTAFKENTARKEAEQEKKIREEELMTFSFEGTINQELRRKLNDKFYDPIEKRNSEPSFMFVNPGEDFGKFLVEIANEYFGIEKPGGDK